MISHFPVKDIPEGIIVYTRGTPQLDDLDTAARIFHDYPLMGGLHFVVIGDPKSFSVDEQIALNRAQIPGFENLPKTEISPEDDQQS